MSRIVLLTLILLLLVGVALPAQALDQPWISDVFFYWYTWDYQRQWGSWEGGVYYKPLVGYYDSRAYDDNLRELWMSSEWGMTHHFMDYWAPDWKANTGEPRDLIVMRAAQAVADRGYNCWMSYYQDGDNFAMKDFARNVTEKRDVWNWLTHYAPFKVWPRLNGLPFQLVYGRNGSPELTATDEGFRAFLKQRYGSVEALSRAWREPVAAFDGIKVDFGSTGPRRADAIDYQYQLWQQDWARLNQAVRAGFPYPGMAASFDVGYQPFRDFGYGDFARVFGGPHSYGGTFAQPNDQDAQRFIQSIVAKKYGTVFLDHLKHTYCDWNTVGRIPGIEYPTEPCAFDRFWVGDLMRYNEAVLHLSWNEFWEGSNLEPTDELGKTYCEKNLLYSTIMQWCFPSIRDFGKDAKVAVLLNDWAFKCGSRDAAEITFAIQEMRRTMAPFDLLVDDLVTAKDLERFDMIVAPAAGVGFGTNRQRERIGDLLKRWVEGGKSRRLVVSACPEFADYLGLKSAPVKMTAERGPDMNLWVDVGTQGDDRFLVGGSSGAEDWGALPPEKFGASPTRHTVRWTPGAGRVTTLAAPSSPNRDHVLRMSGDAIRPSTISVRVGGSEVATIAVREGRHDYEAAIPAAAVGGARMLEIQLAYDHEVIPKEVDPQQYGQESRACDLALDWFEFSTSNVGPSREENYQLPKAEVKFLSPKFGALANRTAEAAWHMRPALEAPGAEVLSAYQPDGIARDLLFADKQVWYVNGRLDDVAEPAAFAACALPSAAYEPRVRVAGKNVMGACLRAGTTDIVLAYNQDISEPANLVASPVPDPNGLPIAEVSVLSRDGETGGNVSLLGPPGWHYRMAPPIVGFRDQIGYYGVYQIVHSPVRIANEALELAPGERKVVPVTLSGRAVRGTIELASVIPTLSGPPVKFDLPAASGWISVNLPIEASETVDWGLKTVALKVTTDAGTAYFWRTLRVLPPPDLRFAASLVDASKPSLTIENRPHPWSQRATARNVRLTLDGQTIAFGDIASGARAEKTLVASAGEGVTSHEAVLSYEVGGRRVEEKRILRVAHPAASVLGPANALRAVQVFNPRETALESEPANVLLPAGLRVEGLHLADADDRPVPAQIEPGGMLVFAASMPARSARTYYLCRAQAKPPAPVTDLVVEPRELGTGRGIVRVANSFFEIVLSEARGGTMTTFRSKASGADYAADSFGVAYGQWSKSDPLKPAHTATEYIVDQRTYQRDTPAALEVASSGPARAVVRVTWRDAAVEATQVYQFWAYSDCFEVLSAASPRAWHTGDELVALDCRFARNGLTKIYPGFSGQPQVFAEPNPHFGWRQAPRVPEFASLLAPPNFAEGISILPLTARGVDRWRQGFWPEKRPEPGPCKYAQAEFASASAEQWAGAATVSAQVMLHAGSQVVAQQARAEVRAKPLVRLTPVQTEAAGRRAAAPADWWNAEWHYRVPVVVTTASPIAASAEVDLGALSAPVDGDSFRLVREESGRVELVPAAVDLEAKQALVQWRTGAGEARYHLYFDTLDHGRKNARTGPVALTSPRFANGTFERGAAGWVLEGATWLAKGGRPSTGLRAGSGPGCLCLTVGPSRTLAVANNGTLAVEPNAEYRVAFWARTASGQGLLRTNFFAGPSYDFGQIEARVPGDGKWHRVELTVLTGAFPEGVAPIFRIWAIGQQQTTYLDDVSVELLSARSGPSEARARVGPVERIAG